MPTEGSLERFVTRVASEWDVDAPGATWRQVDGTLCFVDISGFTNLSEKLARRGRIGAEELTEVLNRVFGAMLRLAYDRGGSLLKFGGDALLLMFEGDDHPIQAASAAVEMRAALRETTRIPTSVGTIPLKMSVGVHTGPIDLFHVGGSHRELVITGATATTTTEMEAAAEAGDILVSQDLATLLPAGAVGDAKGPGRLLRWRKAPVGPVGPLLRRAVPDDVMASRVPTVLRAHLAFGTAEPEHRVATVGFVKFKGVDAAMATGGHDAVAAGLDELVGAVQAAVDDEGVTFLATDIDADGGKVILTTGVPVSQDDDEGRMLRAVRRIADADTTFPLRIGVNRGHVFAGEIGTEFRSTYTVMGDTVNLAARLMAAAPPGGVYAAPSVLDRSRTLFTTEALEPFFVKGKSQPVQAYAVAAESGTRSGRRHGELPFTGRDDELAAIRAAVERLGPGTGGSIGIVGDTGIGKSRLVVEALAGVDHVLTVKAEPNGAGSPYWAFRDPLRDLLGIARASQVAMADRLATAIGELDPGLGPLLPLLGDVLHIDVEDTPETGAIEPRFRPNRTADAVIRLLEVALPGPLVQAFEDTHWLDEASRGLVERLSSTAGRNRPWLVVVTSRDDPTHPLPTVATRIDLGNLDADAARRLVLGATAAAPLRPHDLDTVVARGAGNPLFLEEILRLVRETGSVEGLPESLDAVVGAEVDTLPPLARRLLRYSSVLGRSFRRVVLDELLAPEDVVLDASTRRALSRFIEAEGPERLRFRHAVMHGVAYEGLSYRKRRELHARAGLVIERFAGGDTDPLAGALAHHAAEAGDHARAWRFGVVAGDRAAATYANVEAASHYRLALGHAPRGDDTAASVAEKLGDVLEQAGLFDDALATYGRALRLRGDDPAARADLMAKRARVHARVGSYPAALRQTTMGLRLVEGLPGDVAGFARSRLAALAAVTRLQAGRPADALTAAQRAERYALEVDDRDALAQAYTVLDGAYELLGRAAEAVYADRARSLFEELGSLTGVATVDNNVGVRAYDEGRWDDAVAAYRSAQAAYRQAGNLPQVAFCGANIGEVLVSQGHFEEARRELAEAVRILRAAGLDWVAVWAEVQQARMALVDDPAAAAKSLLALRTEATDLGEDGFALLAALHLADARIRLGLPVKALRTLDEVVGHEEAPYHRVWMLRLRAAATKAAGRIDEAAGLVAEALTAARAEGLPYEEALLLRLRADVDGSERDLEEADRLLQVMGVVVGSST